MKTIRKTLKAAIAMTMSLSCFGLLSGCSSDDSSYAPSISQTSEDIEIPSEDEDPVCYVSSGSENTFYGTVEEGLSNASSGDVVYVIPGTMTYITEDCSIGEGVTLCLPYQGTTYTNGDDFANNGLWGFADDFIDSINCFRKSLVIIDEEVTLTIDDGGSLIVGGFTGAADARPTSTTSRDYCEILMLNNSEIIAEGVSSLYCYGYIKEATYIKDIEGNWNLYGELNNGSRVEMSSKATLLAPLVFYDYNAGYNTVMMTNHDTKVSPVELFDFPNVQSEIICRSDKTNTTSFLGEHKIFSSDKEFADVCGIVGYDDAMINLTSGSLSIKYTPRLAGFTQKHRGYSTYEKMLSSGRCDGTGIDGVTDEKRNLSGSSYEDDEECSYTTFTLNGDASLNKVTIKLTVAIINLTIDTSQFDFPVSYKFRFIIGDGENSASLTVNYATKLMPGCRITVNEKASVFINDTLIMYPSYDNYEYTYWNILASDNGDIDYLYPTGFVDPYVLNNGTVVLDSNASFGGMINTSNEGALFDASKGSVSATSTYGKSYGWQGDWTSLLKDYTETDTITQTAKGYINGYGDSYLADFESDASYVSVASDTGSYWVKR